MGLKELTKDKHNQAEQTRFMQAVISKKIPLSVWADFIYQKIQFYRVLENTADKLNLLDNIQEIKRTALLEQDFSAIKENRVYYINQITFDYCQYISSVHKDKDKIMSHLYTWHMGDLFGGQMIKQLVPGPHASLNFDRRQELISSVRELLNDDMAKEVKNAFDWSIKLMDIYEI